ncbi:GntR family transcriptional regulator [Streptomyces griseoaurantiacus]|uniref:GntR family transcriptional regulator n=1 Tax=Streptomyces griseoaurantiacus TaxID=68213 RepID=UPI002E2B8A80|nr:GntR family transcriptional regulator [Streptomyces jietaisiensis]
MAQPKTPKWRELADRLTAEIRSGERPPGSTLPKIADLAAELGWGGETVRNAYRALSDEGLVVMSKRGGTRVAETLVKIRRDATFRYSRKARETAGAHGAFEAELARLGLVYRAGPTRIAREPAPARVAELLGVDASEDVLVRDRIMYADRPPVRADRATVAQLAASYFPGDLAFGTQLEADDTGPGGSKSRLADLGHAQTTITEEIDVRAPSKAEAAALKGSADRPVYEITHIGRTAEGRVVEVAVHIMPVRLWSLSYTFEVDA